MVEQVAFQTVFQFLQTGGILVGVFYCVMKLTYVFLAIGGESLLGRERSPFLWGQAPVLA